MRIIIGILIGVLLIGALVWPGWAFGHPIWGPWQTQQAETVWVECNGQLFEMPKPADGSFYVCENGQPKLVRMPATLIPTPTPAGQPTQSMVPQGYAYCLPTAVTSLPDRPAMTINNTRVTLQVRDLNTCPRALWEHETGIATGQNYVVDMPEGWAVVVFPTTVAVHREGGTQQDYLNQQIVVVHGPFKGGIGAYEAGVRVVPEEWIDALIAFFKPIQEAQAGHPVQIVHIR
jgi:hypothetical protein